MNKVVKSALGVAVAVLVSALILWLVLGFSLRFCGYDEPGKVREVCSVRFGNYVEVTDGLYAGFKGRIVGQDPIYDEMLLVKIDNNSVPVEFLLRNRMNYRTPDVTEIYFKASELKNCKEPSDRYPLTVITDRLFRSGCLVSANPNKNWQKGEPVIMAGRKYTVAVLVEDADKTCQCDNWRAHGSSVSSCRCQLDLPVKLFDSE